MNKICVGSTEFYRRQYKLELTQEPARSTSFVVSFPKSGRTWHRALIGAYFCTVLGKGFNESFKLDCLTAAAGIGRIRYSHNGANFIDGLPPDDPLVADCQLWKGKITILLVRDIRDILVSAWHHARFRAETTDLSLNAFIRCERSGIEKILTAYNRWHAALPSASKSFVLSYEQMHFDPFAALASTLRLVGISDPDARAIDEAIRQCSFERMRDREKIDFYQTKIASTQSDDPRAMKARVGKVGGYRGVLSDNDLAFVSAAEKRLGNPFAGI